MDIPRAQVASGAQYESLRRVLEMRLVPPSPSAYSIDGRTFSFEAPLSLPLAVGRYVVLHIQDDQEYLGQVVTQEVSTRDGPQFETEIDSSSAGFPSDSPSVHFTDRLRIRHIRGQGRLLGRLHGETFSPVTELDTFQDARVLIAPQETLIRYFGNAGKGQVRVEIGAALRTAGRARVCLEADGFSRRTFLCGQSGSGKTFALGVLLEQLLLETNLKLVVFDPNSDFVHLDQIRDRERVNATRTMALSEALYQQISTRYDVVRPLVRIVRPRTIADSQAGVLAVRFSDLAEEEQTGLLGLDPLDNGAEFESFLRILQAVTSRGPYSLSSLEQAAHGRLRGVRGHRDLAQRIQNLRISSWEAWCQGKEPSVVDILRDDWRCLVLDLGSLTSADQKLAVAVAVLGHLWRDRYRRQPVLVVMDEAQNLCFQAPSSCLEIASTDYVVRIAAEGRKFGVYLMLASQRPRKIHSSALSECDNVIMMRMNSRNDVTYLVDAFSYVPPTLVALCPTLNLGEGLIAGQIVESPVIAKFEGRLTEEGGASLPVGTRPQTKT